MPVDLSSEDITPAMIFGPLSRPLPEAAKTLLDYVETGRLPARTRSMLPIIVGVCDRLLAHPEMPTEWRDELRAVRAELLLELRRLVTPRARR